VVSAGLYQSSKLPLVSRTVLGLIDGASGTRGMTLSATFRVAAGETVAPLLRISRTRFGLSAGNSTDVLFAVSSRVTLIKA